MNEGVLPLLTWSEYQNIGESHTKNYSSQSLSNRSSSHANVRKLANIAFGDGDLQVRGSALQQLNAMIARDIMLLRTMDIDWCMDICRNAAVHASSFKPVGEVGENGDDDLSCNPLVSPEEEFNEYGLQCFIFIRNVLVHVPHLRERISLLSLVDENRDSIDMSFVLRVILHFHSSPFRSFTPRAQIATSRSKNIVLFYALAYDIMSVWTFSLNDTSAWLQMAKSCDNCTDIACSPEYKVNDSKVSRQEGSVVVPHFAWKDFMCVDITKATDLMSLKFLAISHVSSARLVLSPVVEEFTDAEWAESAISDYDHCTEKNRYV
jgi:hypothetical protein